MTTSAQETTFQAPVRVFKGDREVGMLRCDARGDVTFTYAAAVLDDPSAAVSVRLPVRPTPYTDHEARPCFENLLPEGDVRRTLAMATHRAAHDVVGLLGVVGGECAGALSLWPENVERPSPPTYRPCDAETLRAAFDSATALAGLANTMRTSRLSMSGAQEKLVLDRRPPTGDTPTPAYRLPVAGAPSTVLVKRARASDFPGLLQNEVAAMHLMAAAGVPTAAHGPCALLAGTDFPVYETARFDRVVDHEAKTVRRLHAEDGCQVTGKTSMQKYAGTGAPTYAQLVAVLTRYGLDPQVDTELLFRWAVANLALGNRDAHAKNLSVLHDPAGAGVRLAPAYDVVCTLVYPALDQDLPLTFAGARFTAQLTASGLRKAAREFGMTAPRAQELAAATLDALDAARTDSLHYSAERCGDHPVLTQMAECVTEETSRVRAAILP